MDITNHLFHLQEIDKQIRTLKARVIEIDRALESDQRIIMAESQVDSAKKAQHAAQVKLKGIEELARELSTRIEISEKNLYGGSIRNPKELQDLQHEIAALKRQKSSLEDNQLTAMIELEDAENIYQTRISDLEHIRAAVIEDSSTLIGEKSNAAIILNRLSLERSGILHSIPSNSLDLYETLSISKKGQALAKIDEDSCSACGASLRPSLIQSARSKLSLAYCPSCGRILFAG
jgi:predicted  nucleic acid-binding Zn-ribbon protein